MSQWHVQCQLPSPQKFQGPQMLILPPWNIYSALAYRLAFPCQEIGRELILAYALLWVDCKAWSSNHQHASKEWLFILSWLPCTFPHLKLNLLHSGPDPDFICVDVSYKNWHMPAAQCVSLIALQLASQWCCNDVSQLFTLVFHRIMGDLTTLFSLAMFSPCLVQTAGDRSWCISGSVPWKVAISAR